MLNDIKIPPTSDPNGPPTRPMPITPVPLGGVHASPDAAHTPRLAGVKPHEHIHPHTDPKAPGLHKPRIMGEAATTDAIYAMPMEDRGSFFSLALSAVVVGIVGVVLLSIYLLFR